MLLTVSEGIAKLKPLLESRRLMIMAGAGISVDSGLPGWDGLLSEFAAESRTLVERIRRKRPSIPALNAFAEELDAAATYHYPIRIASVIRRRLREIQPLLPENLDEAIRHWFTERFAKPQPNTNHREIVATAYPVILTSNYDMLLEAAAKEKGYEMESYDYTTIQPLAAALFEKTPCIVHIHGKYTKIELDRIVLTAEDYVRIRRENPGFTMTLQALFLGYATLFVGYGSSDPHVEDMLDEMGHYFSVPYRERSFILIHRDKANRVFVEYKDKMNTDVIAIDDYAETSDFLAQLRAIAPRS